MARGNYQKTAFGVNHHSRAGAKELDNAQTAIIIPPTMSSKSSKEKLKKLIGKGVSILDPGQVLIGDEVRVDRIAAKGVVIYPGCRILGGNTLIMSGVRLGSEGPVTVEDCQLGPDVDLKGGSFRGATFLEKASMGPGAHVREGCLLEEQASGAHTVGLKQTILFPFVTLGSIINFCDCLMAGGTSRKDHSEVGSSYIHFNYSAYQDKATASLLGDVPRGVMLDQPPIFLGGQGGLVGPLRIGYGTVIAAGVVCRRDMPGGTWFLAESACPQVKNSESANLSHDQNMYRNVKGRVTKSIRYIANLLALKQWYRHVRSLFIGKDPMDEILHAGALEKLAMAIEERIKRLEALARKMPRSADIYRTVAKEKADERLLTQKAELVDRWKDIASVFEKNLDDPGDASLREPFLEEMVRQIKEKGPDYVPVVQGLEKTWAAAGTAWLQAIVDTVDDQALSFLPSYRE
jgi:hypothetical protein